MGKSVFFRKVALMAIEDVLLLVTGTLTGLIAGLLFGYEVSVNGGLGRLKDSEYVAAMKSINIVIQNPIFLPTFLGPAILLPIVTILHRENTDSGQFMLLLGASVLYIVGTLGVTMLGNVPLNERLDKFEINNASDKEIAEARKFYEKPWNRLHTVRTLASVAALVLVLAASLV